MLGLKYALFDNYHRNILPRKFLTAFIPVQHPKSCVFSGSQQGIYFAKNGQQVEPREDARVNMSVGEMRP